jgi:hypothetical protein
VYFVYVQKTPSATSEDGDHMSICDFLFSADMLVSNPYAKVEDLIATIGLPRPGPNAYANFRDLGWQCVFALVNKSMTVGPTRLEVIGTPDDWTDASDSHGKRLSDSQGLRPSKTHATVVGTPNLEAVGARLRARGVRHWYDTAKEPFHRIWMGVTQEEQAGYDPMADGGLLLELIPSNSVAFSPKLFVTPPPEPIAPSAGQMIRIIARDYLVADIDRTLRILADNLGWEPEGPVTRSTRGTHSVAMSRNYGHGAAVRLVQPSHDDGEHGAFFSRWGPGPYTIRIAVWDLGAKADDLARRGTKFARLAAEDSPERIVVDPKFTAGTPFEFVDYAVTRA